MAYLGNTPTTQSFVPAVDFFSGNASTVAFTLSRPVASVAQVQAVVNNVPQNPGTAFTVSGNTITFTSAPTTGTNNVYIYYTSPITQVIAPSDGTVGTSAIATNAVTTAKILDANVTQSKLGAGVAGNGPAFSAYATATTSLPSGATTKLIFGGEDYDTNNNFASSRFTPTVAGYYVVNGGFQVGTTATILYLYLYKNGSGYKVIAANEANNGVVFGSAQVYLNGTTDYVELYAYQGAATQNATANGQTTYFQAFLARSA